MTQPSRLIRLGVYVTVPLDTDPQDVEDAINAALGRLADLRGNNNWRMGAALIESVGPVDILPNDG